MTEKQNKIQTYADASMFKAEDIDASKGITVQLVSMTEDPLGAVAAACMMYEGRSVGDLSKITDKERVHYAQQVEATHLKAPLEFVKLHFLVTGVPRSITHQMVRQRTAVFAQESMRFAVKENMAEEAYMPASIEDLDLEDDMRRRWFDHLKDVEKFYNYMVANGIPAEDAREILPHCTTTRLHWATDLRNLSDHAGNRLCTQAQFPWRELFAGVLEAISSHSDGGKMLTETNLFKPVCYQVGRCPFQADFDRGCTIRERVDAGKWDEIEDSEWKHDPKAAWQ